MQRTDRLFDLLQILRDGRLHRASDMAERLGVSTRTIWRDMGTLMASGLPVEGERGVGYILRAPITLPPIILTGAELDALRAGLRHVAEGADPGLSRAARTLATKIASVTPAPPEDDGMFSFTGKEGARATALVPVIRSAIKARERLALSYIDPEGRETHQDIRPLELDTSARIWVLGAWCEGRGAFRAFRIDRIVALTPTGETWPPDPGRELEDWRAFMTTG